MPCRCWCHVGHGAQGNSYELQGFGATSGAAEPSLSRVPRGKTCAEAEGPSNLWSRTVPPEKMSPTTTARCRPSAAIPGSGPSLRNIRTRLRVEGAPQPAGGPSDAHFLAQERQNRERGALDDINFTFCSRTQQTKASLQR